MGCPDEIEHALSQSLVAGSDVTRCTVAEGAPRKHECPAATAEPRSAGELRSAGLVSAIAHPGMGFAMKSLNFTPAGREKVDADTSGVCKKGCVRGRVAGRVGQHG